MNPAVRGETARKKAESSAFPKGISAKSPLRSEIRKSAVGITVRTAIEKNTSLE